MSFLPSRRSALRSFAGIGAIALGTSACGPTDPGPADAPKSPGPALEIIDLPQPDLDRITGEGDDFVPTYANFHIANDAVFMPRFGDTKADQRARSILQEHFPKRDIVPVRIDTIASGGGGIHCSTHDQPGRPAA